MKNLTSWTALNDHLQAIKAVHMRDLFKADPSRFDRFSLSLDGILLDYSKNRITDDTVSLLLELARECDLEGQRKAMFDGEAINSTENRAVLHVALRAGPGGGYKAQGEEVSHGVADVLDRMGRFVEAVHSGTRTGATGKRLTDVVNIGIGGSHLGPEMVVQALASWHVPGITVHFVANVDGHDLAQTLSGLNPETTLFLVASKSFNTPETMTNAHSARAWLTEAMDDTAVAGHFVAISSNPSAAGAFGIDPACVFEFWDWVGGRLSLWSAIGLSIALAVGIKEFYALLDGARRMDEHFLTAPLQKNLPVMMALVGIWNINFLNLDTLAVLPYDQRLARFPAFLQQLDMESNGKGVTREGTPVEVSTGPVLFGEPGTNGQHAFYQALHQSLKITPADFIAVAEPAHSFPGHHNRLLANALAQTEALMNGRKPEDTREDMKDNPHRQFGGNRPSNTLFLDRLDAGNLGMLIALYEHKIFVQGAIWSINSFDQWGVELGKQLAETLLARIDGDRGDKSNKIDKEASNLDSSTAGLLARLHSRRSRTIP